MQATFTDAHGQTQTIHWNEESLRHVLDQTGMDLTEIYQPDVMQDLIQHPEKSLAIVAVMVWPEADEPTRSAALDRQETWEQVVDVFFSLAAQTCENLLAALPDVPAMLEEAVSVIVN